MRNLSYSLLLLLFPFFISCQDTTNIKAEKTKELVQVLENSLDLMEDACIWKLKEMKNTVKRAGNSAEGQHMIRRAEYMMKEQKPLYNYISDLRRRFHKTNSSAGIYYLMKGKEGDQLLEQIIQYRLFLKQNYPQQLPVSDSLTQLDDQFIQKFFIHSGASPEMYIAFLSQKMIALKTHQLHYLQKLKDEYREDPKVPFFDENKVYAVAHSNVIHLGDTFKLDIFTVSYTKNLPMRMKANGKPIPIENGIGKVNLPTHTPGKHTWEGEVTIKINHRDTTFTFEKEYTVIPKP